MKKLITAILGLTLLVAPPAAAQTYVIVLGERPTAENTESPTPAGLEKRIEIAIDKACEQPFIRDLKGWVLYDECRQDVRAEIDAQLAGTDSRPVTLAAR